LVRQELAIGSSAYATNPSFVAFLDYLNIRVTGVCEEFAMLINAQERHACSRGVFFGELCSHGVRSFIDFRDEDERAAGLQIDESSQLSKSLHTLTWVGQRP